MLYVAEAQTSELYYNEISLVEEEPVFTSECDSSNIILLDNVVSEIERAEISNGTTYTGTGLYFTSPTHWVRTTSTTSTTTPFITSGYLTSSQVSTTSLIVDHNTVYGYYTTSDYIIVGSQQKLKPNKSADRTVKQSIKRAVKMLERFGLGDDVRMFMKGESIEISHPESNLKFVITKNRDLIEGSRRKTTMSPFKTEVYTKGDIFIAQLCVYSEETPVLDHMLSLALHVKTGDEDIILQKANYTRKSDDKERLILLANERPYLQDKLRIH